MKKIKLLISLLLVFCILLTACGGNADYIPSDSDNGSVSNDNNSTVSRDDDDLESAIFSKRDLNSSYTEADSTVITLSNDGIQCSDTSVSVEDCTVTITGEGIYILRGALDNGSVIIDADKSDKIQLVLDNVNITSLSSAAIYARKCDKLFLTLAPNSINTLANGGSFEAIDDNNIDSVIFSKDDITLNGTGSLDITSPDGHGIVSKDSLKITGGSYTIDAASHAITAKDDICITAANLNLTSGKDCIHAEDKDDASKGFIYIESGVFQLIADGDGISAAASLEIKDGTYDIISGGGSTNGEAHPSDFGGGFGGGGEFGNMPNIPNGGFGGKPDGSFGRDTDIPDKPQNDFRGEIPGDFGSMGDSFGDGLGSNINGMNSNLESGSNIPEANSLSHTGSASQSTTSTKGIKADGDIFISGGTFNINSADDSIHSNTTVTVTGGTFIIASGDDAFHADESLTVSGGTINISESYEGLEALNVSISGGDITLYSTDDGINAAGGKDDSGFGGMFGGDTFGSMGSSNGTIAISGGNIVITAYGDGIDANGSLSISGGDITIYGPTQGDTSTLDFDTTGEITGGTFIGTGSNVMAQSFTSSSQGVIFIQCGNQDEYTAITLTDAEGNIILEHTPALPYNIITISTPDIVKSASYTLTVGSQTLEVTAD